MNGPNSEGIGSRRSREYCCCCCYGANKRREFARQLLTWALPDSPPPLIDISVLYYSLSVSEANHSRSASARGAAAGGKLSFVRKPQSR